MNIFKLLFEISWALFSAYMIYLLWGIWKRWKELESCAYCKHYKGCKELHQIIDAGIPMPCACSGFERREDGKRWPRPRRRKGKKEAVL